MWLEIACASAKGCEHVKFQWRNGTVLSVEWIWRAWSGNQGRGVPPSDKALPANWSGLTGYGLLTAWLAPQQASFKRDMLEAQTFFAIAIPRPDGGLAAQCTSLPSWGVTIGSGNFCCSIAGVYFQANSPDRTLSLSLVRLIHTHTFG